MAKRKGGWSGKRAKKPAGLPAASLGAELPTLDPARLRCLALLGAESFLIRAGLDALREHLVGDNPGPSYGEYEGQVELATVLDEVRTMPFLGASRRLVVVRNAGPFISEHGEALLRFLPTIPDTSTLVLCAKKIDRRFKVNQKLIAALTQIDCGAPDEAGLLGFARRRAKHWGRPFARGCERALLERLGGEDIALELLDAEVRKLAGASKEPEITAAEVEALASTGSHEDTFALIGRMSQGDLEGALDVLARIFRDGLITGSDRTSDGMGIAMIVLGTLRWDLTRLMRARTLEDEGALDREGLKGIKVFRDQAAFRRRLGRADAAELRARHRLLRKADFALRNSASAQATLTDAVSQLTLRERSKAGSRA